MKYVTAQQHFDIISISLLSQLEPQLIFHRLVNILHISLRVLFYLVSYSVISLMGLWIIMRGYYLYAGGTAKGPSGSDLILLL